MRKLNRLSFPQEFVKKDNTDISTKIATKSFIAITLIGLAAAQQKVSGSKKIDNRDMRQLS